MKKLYCIIEGTYEQALTRIFSNKEYAEKCLEAINENIKKETYYCHYENYLG